MVKEMFQCPVFTAGFVRVETENAKIRAGSVPCREVKQREEYKDTNEPKSIHAEEERETTKRGKYLSFFVFDSAFTFLQQTRTRREKLSFREYV
jgi:hypothetical protein